MQLSMTKAQQDSLLRILHTASKYEVRERKRKEKKENNWLFRNYLWAFQFAPFTIAIVLVLRGGRW